MFLTEQLIIREICERFLLVWVELDSTTQFLKPFFLSLCLLFSASSTQFLNSFEGMTFFCSTSRLSQKDHTLLRWSGNQGSGSNPKCLPSPLQQIDIPFALRLAAEKLCLQHAGYQRRHTILAKPRIWSGTDWKLFPLLMDYGICTGLDR